MSLLVTPYLFLPTLGYYGLGLLNFVGLGMAEQTYFLTTLVAVTFASVVIIFEYRFYVLLPRSNIWCHIRIPWLIMNYIFAIVAFIPTYFNTPDRDYAKIWYFFGQFCVPSYIEFDKLFFVSLDYYFQVINYTILVEIYFWQIFVFAFLTNRSLSNQIVRNSSSHTVKLQKSFQKALIAQVSIPTIVVLLPLGFMLMVVYFQMHYQYMNNFAVITIASHGFFSTIAMLTIHRPYREYTLILIRYHILFRHGERTSEVELRSNVIT